MEWEQIYGETGYTLEGYSVQQTTDGGYILGGYILGYGTDNYQMYLMKTNSDGIMEWDHIIGGEGEEKCLSV